MQGEVICLCGRPKSIQSINEGLIRGGGRGGGGGSGGSCPPPKKKSEEGRLAFWRRHERLDNSMAFSEVT